MQLFVGLGNPGAKYARNRHNIGFMAVEAIAEAHGFGPWRARFQGLASEGVLGGEKVILLKPGTFMNLSGQSVGEAARFYRIAPEAVTVFHDELDLGPGKLRVKRGGGHAGHNGLRSIIAHIGADFQRVRLGIGHPGHKDRVTGHVLSDFASAEAGWLDALMRAIAQGAPWLAQGAPERFQTAVAQRMAPPRPGPAPASDAATARPASPPPAPAEDTRSPMQKLVDRFR
ncbi:MAG: aminoacyl-tRNA hydrolase [Roseovarius sp.]|nr:aminoacyl-tRNA hydrolase [Roseovarius sp.]